MFGCHGKYHFPENDFQLTTIFTFDPEIIYSPHFHFKSLPERERERERERESHRKKELSEQKRERARERTINADHKANQTPISEPNADQRASQTPIIAEPNADFVTKQTPIHHCKANADFVPLRSRRAHLTADPSR